MKDKFPLFILLVIVAALIALGVYIGGERPFATKVDVSTANKIAADAAATANNNSIAITNAFVFFLYAVGVGVGLAGIAFSFRALIWGVVSYIQRHDRKPDKRGRVGVFMTDREWVSGDTGMSSRALPSEQAIIALGQQRAIVDATDALAQKGVTQPARREREKWVEAETDWATPIAPDMTITKPPPPALLMDEGGVKEVDIHTDISSL